MIIDFMIQPKQSIDDPFTTRWLRHKGTWQLNDASNWDYTKGGELFEFFFFFPGDFCFCLFDSCYLIFAAFRNYNLGFHVVFCSSYACWVGGCGGLGI